MKGIGQEGKTLKQLLEESEEAFNKTGYLFGLKETELATKDPLKLELFHTRLRAAMVAGREQVRQISTRRNVDQNDRAIVGGFLGHIPDRVWCYQRHRRVAT